MRLRVPAQPGATIAIMPGAKTAAMRENKNGRD
jgi:hypothetical protein